MAVKFWTKEEIATLKQMWSAGKTAQEIADALGRPRNGVIGQAHRSGLEKRQSPIQRKKSPRVVEIEKTREESYAGQGFNFKRASRKKPSTNTTNKELRDEKRAEINRTAYGTPKKMIDLEPNECRWPVSGEGSNMLFCGAPTVNGVYCEKHCTISKDGKMHVAKYIKPHGK